MNNYRWRSRFLSVKQFTIFVTAFIFATSIGWASLAVDLLAVPSGVKSGTSIYPVVLAQSSDSSLTAVSLSYSWDNVNWTELAASPYPGNPFDLEGNALPLNQTGTLYFKGWATDSSGTNTQYWSTTVSSGTSTSPSVLSGSLVVVGYNYGCTLMYDSSTGGTKMWWAGSHNPYYGTLGGVGGDSIFYEVIGSSKQELSVTNSWTGDTSSGSADPGHLISDPSVLKVSGLSGGPYIMYITEAPYQYGGNDNDIAYSTSSDGISWSSPTRVIYSQYGSTSAWGAGWPCAVRLTSGGGSMPYCMLNVDKDTSNVYHVWFRRSSDGTTWSNSVASNSTDVTNGKAVEIDMSGLSGTDLENGVKWSYYNGYWYVIYADTSGGLQVYRTSPDSTTLQPTTSWSFVGSIAPADMMQNKWLGTFQKDENGYISLYGGKIVLTYTTFINGQSMFNGPYWGSQFYYELMTPP